MRSSLPILLSLFLPACVQPAQDTAQDPMRLEGPEHFLEGYPARGAGDTIHVVVEIPAGTNAKWEVEKSSGSLAWEVKDGRPRVVQYLPYPANYGMVPRTLLPQELGGDGDPLDVLLLGPAVPRGSVVEARLLGVLHLLDRGEQDDKLIAIALDSPLGAVSSLEELDAQFRGVSSILETWMSNYKGPGKMQSQGFSSAAKAEQILEAAVSAYAANE